MIGKYRPDAEYSRNTLIAATTAARDYYRAQLREWYQYGRNYDKSGRKRQALSELALRIYMRNVHLGIWEDLRDV